MIKYVALWKLAEGVPADEFEKAYRRHINAVIGRPGLKGYRIGRLTPAKGMNDDYYRMAELWFTDEATFREWMGSLNDLPEEDPANPRALRNFMSSVQRFLCEDEVLI